MTDAQFEGQTKTKLGNSEIRPLVDDMVYEKLTAYFEENPAVARPSWINPSLRPEPGRPPAGPGADPAQDPPWRPPLCPASWPTAPSGTSTRRKSTSWRATPPAVPPRSGRDRRFQAILPLWGKMLNVEKARLDRVYGNDKLMPMVTGFGLRHRR